MSRNEDIVEAYFDAGGRNIGELARKYDLWPDAIYAIVAAGGAEIDLGPRPKTAARAPMLHALTTVGAGYRPPMPNRRGRPPGTAIKLKLTDEELLAEVTEIGAPKVAASHGVTSAAIYDRLNRMGYSRADGNMPGPKVKSGPKRSTLLRADGGSLRRFKTAKADPSRTVGLAADHPAVVEGRTLFPGTVVGAMQSPRFLVSGHNNSKIGKLVTKGPWTGMPIYTLTLEERATCPRSCAVWSECYGNAMQWPRRANAFDPDFIPALACEVVTTARLHPQGFVVRLHVLGDFFSPAYVRCWGLLLELLPGLHVWGYTARRLEDPDPLSAAIAREVQKLNERWDRWAVRTSHTEPGPDRTIVVDADPELPDVIMCPQQSDATAACGTCAMCWSSAARDKTVAFLRHGMKRLR